MTFHGKRQWDGDFYEELQKMGAIFELFIDQEKENHDQDDARIIMNPSVQMVINEDHTVSVVSTHEQLLENQVYHGCIFPCREDYRVQIMHYGMLVGQYLAERGVTDHFSVDFMCVPCHNGGWRIFAVEVNLRITGTTHPFMAMKLLTQGSIDKNTGLFMGKDGKNKYYVSSDHVYSPHLKCLEPKAFYELMQARRQDLHWSSDRQVGVVCNLISCMEHNGTLSIAAIGNSKEQARYLFNTTRDYLVHEAQKISSKIIQDE